MKKIFCLLIAFVSLVLGPHNRIYAQEEEIAQLLLNIEKLSQFKGILSDMKKGYDILNGGYKTIKDISEGNFSIHKTFLDGLMEVSPAVRNYRKIPQIMNNQLLLAREYNSAIKRFRGSDMFTIPELQYMERVYTRLLKHSKRDLDELLMIITTNQMRMSDDERLKAIDRIHKEMEDKLMFLRNFNNNSAMLELNRQKQKRDIETIRNIHGIGN